jgi:hypothetical protein
MGKLFVDDGNTELSSEVASYTTDQKAFVIKTIYSSGCSYDAVER